MDAGQHAGHTDVQGADQCNQCLCLRQNIVTKLIGHFHIKAKMGQDNKIKFKIILMHGLKQ